MDEAIQAEKHADWIRSIVNQNEALQAAGDALAEEVAKFMPAPFSEKLRKMHDDMKAKLADWNAAKEMR